MLPLLFCGGIVADSPGRATASDAVTHAAAASDAAVGAAAAGDSDYPTP